ncbi:twin-arginine translocation signal domain-containing protein [Nocardia sp. CA-135953]|uniref:twin-arginine translocation signal domain-containing protein n=1 Tax=Nocardia sp. CA-135953 TaxID=3239978 RepID=UPI003D95E96A
MATSGLTRRSFLGAAGSGTLALTTACLPPMSADRPSRFRRGRASGPTRAKGQARHGHTKTPAVAGVSRGHADRCASRNLCTPASITEPATLAGNRRGEPGTQRNTAARLHL